VVVADGESGISRQLFFKLSQAAGRDIHDFIASRAYKVVMVFPRAAGIALRPAAIAHAANKAALIE